MSEEEQMNVTPVWWCCVFFSESKISILWPCWVIHIFKQRKFCGIPCFVEKSWPTSC